MPWWGWLIIVGAAGVALLVLGALRDRTIRRRRERMLVAPPPPVPGVEGGEATPRYVTLEEARRPRSADPLPPLSLAAQTLLTGDPLPLRLADVGFATTLEGYAVLEHPIVLVCAEPVGTLRELYPALSAARNTEAGIVIIAPTMEPTTVETLLVNRRQDLLHVAVVTGDDAARSAAAARCGAQPVDRSDLQAGYLPPPHLGGCPLWVSGTEQSWIAPPTGAVDRAASAPDDPLGSAG